MFHYLFTNDLRISNLESFLVEAARCFKEDRVPSASVDKNANNNINTLGFYFNLTEESKCTTECANGNVRKVILNFIKKFQFPNPRTSTSLKDCITDEIKISPMRVILQTLYMMRMVCPEEAFLSNREIADYIFFNESVAKVLRPDISKLVNDIIDGRKNKNDGSIPDDKDLENRGCYWKQCKRQIREMVKILLWSGCVIENKNGSIKIQHDHLSRDNEADIFEVLTFSGFWNPDPNKSVEENKKSYQMYMDIENISEETSHITTNNLTPEWFRDKAEEFVADDNEASVMYADFNDKFGIDAISHLSGEKLLQKLFLGASSDNLCHELEYVARNSDLFGSIKGGSAFKYPMFFDKKTLAWISGSGANPKQLSLDDAIAKGTSVRDSLIKGAKIIENSFPIESVEDYLNLYAKMHSVMPELVDNLWVIKYYHMIFPKLIPIFYNKDWQIRILKTLKIVPNGTVYGRLGQINAFVKKCGTTNVAFARVVYKYFKNIDVDESGEIEADEIVSKRKKGGANTILYGVPGAGKSWTIKNEYCSDESCMERIVFHPDYTYSDFIGQIFPRISDDGSVSYEFVAGPFTKLLRKAYVNPDKMFYLIIEEVNRGNAPAIFGDVFQLLDRDDDGSSEYKIANEDIAKFVYSNANRKVFIPSNMSILCTMNTSDQNVFTLDTAFQRRWDMRLIKNKFNEMESEFAKTKILDTDVTWKHFVNEINKIILSKNIRMTSSEDKRLGTHFVVKKDIEINEGNKKQINKFPEKVLKYLWDDAFKFNREDIFDLDRVKSLEDVIEKFIEYTGNERLLVFKDNIYNALISKNESN